MLPQKTKRRSDMADKNTMETLFEEGVRAFVSGEFEKSESRFSRLIETEPRFSLAYVSRGAARLRLEKLSQAIEDFDTAVGLNPDSPRAFHLRGLARERLGAGQSALEDLDRAIELDPEYGAAYHSRSAVLSRMGREDAAFEDMKAYTHITEKKLREFANEHNIWQSRHLAVEEAGLADVMVDR
jgi:tetratricopeptide (TPR) repeat protein